AFRHAFAHGEASGGLERHVGAVHRMILTIVELDGDIDHREPEWPALHEIDDPLLHRGDEIARYGAADDGILKLETFAACERADLDMNIAELPVPAALSFV